MHRPFPLLRTTPHPKKSFPKKPSKDAPASFRSVALFSFSPFHSPTKRRPRSSRSRQDAPSSSTRRTAQAPRFSFRSQDHRQEAALVSRLASDPPSHRCCHRRRRRRRYTPICMLRRRHKTSGECYYSARPASTARLFKPGIHRPYAPGKAPAPERCR